MYKAVIRTKSISNNISNNPLRKFVVPNNNTSEQNLQKKKHNHFHGFIHLFRNTKYQNYDSKSQIILILFPQQAANQNSTILLKYLQSRKDQIECIDHIFYDLQQDKKQEIKIGMVVIFKNIAISSEIFNYIQQNLQQFLALYIQEVLILSGWDKAQNFKGKFSKLISEVQKKVLQQNLCHSKGYQNKQWVELPTCLICLSKLEVAVTGIKVAPTLEQTKKSSCQVCKIINYRDSKGQTYCDSCKQIQDNWVCLVCGLIGCGRYKNGDAFKHFISSGHIISMDLQTKRVWNYRSDCFSHRLLAENEIGVKFPDYEDSNLNGNAIQGAFWQYCSIVSEQLDKQRIFYEDNVKKSEIKFKAQLTNLEDLIAELKNMKAEKLQILKKQSKKVRKIEKKLEEVKQKCLDEREVNKQYQQVLNSEYTPLQEDQDIIKKKKELQQVEASIQQAFLKLTGD